MDKLPIDNEFFSRFIQNLSQFFGAKSEIAIHDFRNNYEHSVVAIAGNISGRKVGDNSSEEFIEMALNGGEELDANPVYFGRSENGAVLKTCSTLIRDAEGKVVGAVCVFVDVTDLILAQNAIHQSVQYKSEGKSLDDVLMAMDVDSLMQHYISMAETLVGKPPQLMNKEEKIRALAYLDNKGVFKIHKAGVILCDAFQISKYTLYSYLDEAKQYNDQNA